MYFVFKNMGNRPTSFLLPCCPPYSSAKAISKNFNGSVMLPFFLSCSFRQAKFPLPPMASPITSVNLNESLTFRNGGF